ncbi:MAG: hypothetical protein ABI758_05090 [Candidatus Woesebacteria bacterium]
MFILLAQNNLNIGAQSLTISPVQTIGKVVELGAGGVLVVGTLAVLLYLLMGGFNWITAGGDKSKIETARSEITQAIIGLAILASVFAIFRLLLGFFGLGDRINLGFGGTTGGGNTGGQNPTAQTCAGNVAVNATVNDGGAGGYCTGGGAAMVKCEAAGVGGLSYVHYEPCSCVTGTHTFAWPNCP